MHKTDRQGEQHDEGPPEDRPADELAGLRKQLSESRARLDELCQANRELDALTRVTDNALGTLDVRELVDQLVERLADVVQADAGTIVVKQNEGLEISSSIGIGREEIPGFAVPAGEEFTRVVMSTDKPLYIEDALRDPRITSPFIREQGIHTMLGVPLRHREKTVGALYLLWFKVRPENPRDIRLLEVTADRCAMAIDNALLFEQAKAVRDQLEQKVLERTAELSDVVRDLNLEAEVRKRTEADLRLARREIDFYFDLMGRDIGERDRAALAALRKAIGRMDAGGCLGKADAQLLAEAVRNVEGSVEITGNIRMLRQAAAERQSPGTVDLREVLQETVARFAGANGGRVKISLRMSMICERLGCKVTATALHREVYANIIRNAIDRSSGPLTIDVSLSLDKECGEHCCRVVIVDDGPGIPDELKHRIFEAGETDIAEKRIEGLGLLVVRTLVGSAGGTVRVEDRVPGDYTKGSRFVVTMPAKFATPW